MIRMPDGVRMSAADFHRLKTAVHADAYFADAASFVSRVSNAIPQQEWEVLTNWMSAHNGAVPLTFERKAHFLVVLAKHVGREQRQILEVIARIVKRGSVVGTFIAKA